MTSTGKARFLEAFIRDERGAVAATYALALIGLVAVAGVGFDFARLATMSSELHNAADQAALAAATQLDGSSASMTNAVSAANNLVGNETLLANDNASSGKAVTIASVTFFEKLADAEANTNGFTDPAQYAKANFVRVVVNARQAFYALTPIVGALSSGNIDAAATAGMGSALCKVPPMMMCNTNSDPNDPNVGSLIGKGLLLKGSGSSSWVPGDYGFLDVGTGANALKQYMAYGDPPGGCINVSRPATEPGNKASVTDAYNTRFDIYNDSLGCYGTNNCPGSDNSRKDVVQPGSLTTSSPMSADLCGTKKGWTLTPYPYRPTSANKCSATYPCAASGSPNYPFPDAMGYPRDLMHAWQNPNMDSQRLGDGNWDINAYWKVNHGAQWDSLTTKPLTTSVSGRTYPTRYEVYEWERNNKTAYRQFTSGGKSYTDFQAPMCSAGSTPDDNTPDRRVLPVAIVNCTNMNGKSIVIPEAWVDVFLVEPSLDRGPSSNPYTSAGEFYVEVVRQVDAGAGVDTTILRNKPYLVN